MELSRRALIGSTVGATMFGAGCTGVLTGSEPISVSAQAASIPESKLSATGFQKIGTKELSLSKELTVAGQTRTVKMTNYVSQYGKQVKLPDGTTAKAALFAALAVPLVTIANETINPFEGLDPAGLVGKANVLYNDVTVSELLGTQQLNVLGSPREVARHAATAAIAQQTNLDVLLQLSRFQHAGDFLGLMGFAPMQLSPEQKAVLTLAQAVTHGGG